MLILRIALPTPLRRSFDYLAPENLNDEQRHQLTPGCRVSVPFGNRELIGILIAIDNNTEFDLSKLKPATVILDTNPIFENSIFKLASWAANYYHHSLGEVLQQSIPPLLRKGKPLVELGNTHWRISKQGKGISPDHLKRSHKQKALFETLLNKPLNKEQLEQSGFKRPLIKALEDKCLIESYNAKTPLISPSINEQNIPVLNKEQEKAISAVSFEQYQCSLLEGITGSGKTEVYLQLIGQCLKEGKQALVLIPEIGLSPQTLNRFKERFNCQIEVLNSSISEQQRLISWQQAGQSNAHIVIGTRSAIFTPLPKLGLIIIDEEHDQSFKQQDGFRYSARDLGIKRAFDAHCPIVLGSATPSLESLHNAQTGKYQHLTLRQRAGNAKLADIQLLDICGIDLQQGFSPFLLKQMQLTLQRGEQVLVFINRRGFAPALHCHSCGHIAECQNCDARLTVHMVERKLRCHHCESQYPLKFQCQSCGSHDIDYKGSGTERTEQSLQALFPNNPVIRIDRDSTSSKFAMQELLKPINDGESCILVGTQMLAKGHHFPKVTLVAMLDADNGLFSPDFRGAEHTGQLLLQVAGRAGRAELPGKVYIQTYNADNPLLKLIAAQDYPNFTKQLLQERANNAMPPFHQFCLVRAEFKNLFTAESFLKYLRQHCEYKNTAVNFYGPLPAPLARKAGWYRSQLLLQSHSRQAMQESLRELTLIGEQHKKSSQIRWSIDVDPIYMS